MCSGDALASSIYAEENYPVMYKIQLLPALSKGSVFTYLFGCSLHSKVGNRHVYADAQSVTQSVARTSKSTPKSVLS